MLTWLHWTQPALSFWVLAFFFVRFRIVILARSFLQSASKCMQKTDRDKGSSYFVDISIYREELTLSSYKNFLWESDKNVSNKHQCRVENLRPAGKDFKQDLQQGPVRDYGRTPKGPLPELPTRTDARSCKGLWQHFTIGYPPFFWAGPKSHKCLFTEEFAATSQCSRPGQTLQSKCACYMDVSQGPYYARIYLEEKKSRPKSGTTTVPTFCASLRSRDPHEHLTRAIFVREFTAKMRGPRSGQPCWAHFAQACAIEMHMNISGIYLFRNLHMEHPDPTPAWTPTVRTAQCEHTV